jgi:hypothetical protein
MSTFNFTLPNGKPFEIKGPPGLSLEQAKAIFDKQAETGSLVGLKPGDALSAATQAASGLKSAQALLSQAQSGITGALGAAIPGAAGALGSVSSALGAAGGAINGSLADVASGLTGAVGSAVSLSGAASIVSGGAATAIGTINETIAGVPLLNEIDITDFAKQIPASTSIGPLSVPDVTSIMAQAKKLVDQAGTIVTDAKGLGEFGLSPAQLESAGFLKPGMAKFVADGASNVTDLLKSPAAFTGKDGVKSAEDLLNNLTKQGLIQQDLMKKGMDALKAFGVPVDLLSAAGAAGAALNSAIDPAAAAAFLKKIPGIGEDLAEKFLTNTRDGAFAADLVKKIPPAFKAEVVPVPAANTVNRDTVNAASARVVGNPKVPEPNYGPNVPDPSAESIATEEIKRLATELADLIAVTSQELDTLNSSISALEGQATITDQQWETVNAERLALSERYNPKVVPLNNALLETINSTTAEVRIAYTPVFKRIQTALQELRTNAIAAKTRVNELAKKKQGPPEETTA